MGKELSDLAQELKDSDKQIHLIYAFNGVGKTRLSCAFKQLFRQGSTEEDTAEEHRAFLYYNAFTEDLFYWDNDLENDQNVKMMVQANSFTDWIYNEEGKENDIQRMFSHYTNSKVEANYNQKDGEIVFSFPGEEESIKISKSEESCFIWCIFFSILEGIIDDINDSAKNNMTSKFNDLKYVFIDDPVSSLDENHLIEQAVDLSETLKRGCSSLRFIVTTHNPLFFNVLFNELNNKDPNYDYRPKVTKRYQLEKTEDGLYQLEEIEGDTPFAYHIHMLEELKKAIESNSVKKYHFNLLRNILEKTGAFLGYTRWGDLLLQNNSSYQARLINTSSHSKLSSTEVPVTNQEDIAMIKSIVDFIAETYHFNFGQPSGNTNNS